MWLLSLQFSLRQSADQPLSFRPCSVHVAISERLSLELLRDGGLASFDLKGELELLVSDPSLSKIKLDLIAPTESASFASDIQFKHHPNVAKFAPNGPRAIALRDPKRDFPVGKGLGVVKWKLAGTKESLVPLSINCWPSAGEGNVEVNIEFELEAKHLTLRDVCISIPIPCVPPLYSFNFQEFLVDTFSFPVLCI